MKRCGMFVLLMLIVVTDLIASIETSWAQAPGTIVTVAGGGSGGDGGQAVGASLNEPYGVFVDGDGNIYIADSLNHRVRKVDTNGIITTVAGIGPVVEPPGDGGPATEAGLNFPFSVCVDELGNLYIGDYGHHLVRKVDHTTGIITTVAGTGTPGYDSNEDHHPATQAKLNAPAGVFVDRNGNLYIGDQANHRVRKVDTTGIITTVAGRENPNDPQDPNNVHDGGPATLAYLNQPTNVYVDGQGNLYIGDASHHRVLRLSPLSRPEFEKNKVDG